MVGSSIYVFIAKGLYHQTQGCDVMKALECQQDFAAALGVEPGASESVAVFKVKMMKT